MCIVSKNHYYNVNKFEIIANQILSNANLIFSDEHRIRIDVTNSCFLFIVEFNRYEKAKFVYLEKTLMRFLKTSSSMTKRLPETTGPIR